MRGCVSVWAHGAVWLFLLARGIAVESDPFGTWHVGGDWYSAQNARLDTWNERRLIGDRGEGVLVNGRIGKTRSLITKRRDYRDVELHVEFLVAKGANSGIIFHGNYEIQILDSAHVKDPTGAHCGGIYPRAETHPKYHHIDKGSPPSVNAAKPPGEWQSMEIIFQSPRFDGNGKKTANARFVKVVHNGQVIQENVEVPYACGPNWSREQHPRGPIIIQGDYGPIAIRNVRVKDWEGQTGPLLNVPPPGFAALFNGKDLAGWHTPPLVREYWKVEDGILRSPGLIKTWGACLATKKHYRDFILMLDFRMPTISDSGINFRRLTPEIPGFGNQEQFNLRSKGGMGHLESYYFLPKETAKRMDLKEEEKPHVRHIDPEVGIWHTVKLTVQGRTLSAEFDGEVLYDRFQYHDWMINMEPAPIRLQKHIVVHGDNLGATNACPIEYRNVFIKVLDPPAERPNVVILLADDLGWQDIGCYGGPVKTPALDALAAEGVRFTDFHAGASVCSPSRATLLTGRQHMRTGIYHVLQDSTHNAHLLEREVTIAELLKQAGYATAHFGKWHLGLTSGKRRKPSPTEHGFDYWFGVANGAGPSQKDPVNFIRNGKRVGPMKGYSCQIVVDDAVQWLSEHRPPDQPFFLNIWFNEPHSVLAAPDEIVSRYGGLKDPAALYSGAVENTDRAIAHLVARLRDMDELKKTVIIYSSDNGSYREDRNGGFRGSKGSNFEGGIRSPGIFYWPGGIKGGRVEREPAGAVDLLPTICGLVGIDKPSGVHLDGADLSPLLTGRGTFHRPQLLFWHRPASYPAALVRDGRYALAAYSNYEMQQDHRAMATLLKRIEDIVGKDDGTSGEGNLRSRVFNSTFDSPEANRLRMQYVRLNTFQESWIPSIKAGGFGRFGLYDLDADPRQEKDISAQQPEVAARLKQQLLSINASVMTDAPDWSSQPGMNKPPGGFTALFNGKDLTGWRVAPKARGVWSVEDGVLKASGSLAQWVPDIETEEAYRDFVLLVDYRMPTVSDSGIFIRGLVPVLEMGRQEQINIGPGLMGHPTSFHYLTPDIRLTDAQFPHVKEIRPKAGAWHTMKVTLVGKTLSVEVDGEVILREYEYPEGLLSMAPSPIGLQKHVRQEIEGKMSDMPIEFRNIFIKEVQQSDGREPNVPPEGFTALFNGKNFNGWRLSPAVRDAWSIEDGVLKSHKAIRDWGSDLRTEKKYRDFVLLVDYRIPEISDSGIYIRGLMPGIGIFDRDRWEQFNLRSRGGTGTLESFRFQPPDRRVAPPQVRPIDPEIGVWHTVKLTLIGKTLSAEYDGETIIDRYEYADDILSMAPSVIRLQKHAPCEIDGEMSDCPIEFRNIFIKEIKSSGFPREIKPPELNVPPRGFTALFNGRDFTGWQLTPRARDAWTIEDGVLKAHREIREWGADLTTQKKYRDFVLLLDFKFPTISDSGIWFRGIPGIMGGMEQFNLMSIYGTGNLDSLDHLPEEVQRTFRGTAYTPFFYCQPDYYRLGNTPVRYTDPEIGVWHTVKLTLVGRTLSAELDGHVIHDRFEYPEGTISMAPAPIRLQKHMPQTIAGRLYKQCPIEFRNIFIKELEPPGAAEPGGPNESDGHLAKLFVRIEKHDLPEAYNPARHQDYVDRRMAGVSQAQRARIGQLWKEKRRIDPDMPNRGQSFVRIMEYVVEHER